MSDHSLNMRHVVFDIDGTLVDTEPLVREAYRLAGVDMPKEAWGRPWQEWLPAFRVGRNAALRVETVHRRKTAAYLELLRMTPPTVLPPGRLAQDLVYVGTAEVGFLTGASQRAAEAILDILHLPKDLLLGYSCTLADKVRILGTLDGDVEYYDDDPDTVSEVGQFVKAYDWRDLKWTQ